MITLRRTMTALFLPVLGACATAQAAPTMSSSASVDPALTHERANAALAGIAEAGKDCKDLALTGGPIAVSHFQDPNLQQTVARARVSLYSTGTQAEAKNLEGTVLATMVGKEPSGQLRGNHHIVFSEGTIRTEKDLISITPTNDKCIVNAKAQIFFKDGTGEFAGYSGTGNAEATLNFCGGVGHAVVYGRLCKAN